ncbi:universal stress protein [Microbacterium sp. NPDC057407]|uniref:universal stress protein n=1 Tax=Microbacterium sp. NPDC057407 TaxID=3346120 RepID=UPI00366B141D
MPETYRDPRGTESQPPLPWDRPGILVGVDGSRASLAALRRAVDMGPKLGLPAHAVMMWDYPTFVSGTYGDPWGGFDPQQHAAEVLGDAAKEMFPDGPPDWFTWSPRRGRPARELVKLSAEAALIVVGGRGHGGFAGLLLGSVSDACAAHAQCPVLVMHDR